MDAKWNDIADNMAVRVTLTMVGFGAWLALSVALLAMA